MATIPNLSTVTSAVGGASSAVGGITKAVGGVTGVINSEVSKIGGAISSGISNIASAIRSAGLPFGAETSAATGDAQALFGSSDVGEDWRVRLSIPPIKGFNDSPILGPLRGVGGMVFPYTPTIQLSHSAMYNDIPITHQNFQFSAYESSRVDQITISAPFNVEDGQQATYWIAALHYFRSVTKMFSGADANAGNPPPIVKFNAYGEHVFNNVPVVVKSFSFDLPADSNYIPADANYLSTILGFLGGGTAGAIGGLLGGVLGGVEKSRVPTKSTLNVVLQPVYSREAARKFSLDEFVKGDYVKTGGYL